MEKDYLTVEECAERLHVHRKTVLRKVKRGELVGAIHNGRRVYIPKSRNEVLADAR